MYIQTMPKRRNRTYYLADELMEMVDKRSKAEGRSASRMIEIMMADYLRRHGIKLGEDFPDFAAPSPE